MPLFLLRSQHRLHQVLCRKSFLFSDVILGPLLSFMIVRRIGRLVFLRNLPLSGRMRSLLHLPLIS